MSSISTSYVVQLNASGNLVSAIDGLSVRFPQLNKAVNKVKNSLGGLTVNMLAFNQMTDGLRATTEHLHLETRINGTHFNPNLLFNINNNSLLTTTLKARNTNSGTKIEVVQ